MPQQFLTPEASIRHCQSSTQQVQQKTLLTQLKGEPGLTWLRAPSRSQSYPKICE